MPQSAHERVQPSVHYHEALLHIRYPYSFHIQRMNEPRSRATFNKIPIPDTPDNGEGAHSPATAPWSGETEQRKSICNYLLLVVNKNVQRDILVASAL